MWSNDGWIGGSSAHTRPGEAVGRWHPSDGDLPDAHPARSGRPIVHLATRSVVGWTVRRDDVSHLGRLDALLRSLDGSGHRTTGERPPLVVVPWCPTIAHLLMEPLSPDSRLRDVIIDLPSPMDPHQFDVALARVEAEHLRAAVGFTGDVAAIVDVHERGALEMVRIPAVRSPAGGGPAALETRLGMRLLEALDEAGVTVMVDGVDSLPMADRLRRSGIRFAQGPLFDTSGPTIARAESWRSPTAAPLPFEGERLAMVARSHILDSPPEEAFDAVVDLVADRCRTPMAAVSIVDHDRQWFKASRGLAVTETPRSHAFCAVAITQQHALIVPDALQDPRFATNPLVLGHPYIRSYLGVPLRAGNGMAFGALCVMDREPRRFDPHEVREVTALARLVTDSLELRTR